MSTQPHDHEMPPEEQEEEESFLEADDAEEVIPDDPDHPMDDENEDEDTNILEELQLVNDSSAHLDAHQDSIFTIAQHPTHPEIVATGGGDDVGYIFDSTPPPGPVLPTSYETNPQPTERESLKPILKLDGHQDSINAVAFTQPKGEYVVTAGLDGRLRAWKDVSRGGAGTSWKSIGWHHALILLVRMSLH
jgi:ribosome assembly protein SQT1